MVSRVITRQPLGSVLGEGAELAKPGERPYYRIRLRPPQLSALESRLEAAAASDERGWFTLTATSENPNRLRLTKMRAPDFENAAAPVYLRGEAFRISGKGASCNIDFNPVGARLIAERLRAARATMNEWVELRIPNRKRQLIEFVADSHVAAASSAESDKLGLAGAQLAAELLANEDFSDWDEEDA